MTAVETIGGVAASLSLLDNLYSLVKNARSRGGDRLSAAEVIKKLPVEAFSIAKQISRQLIALEEELKGSGVDMSVPVEELASHYDWWKLKRYRAARKVGPVIEGLKNATIALLDDCVAVASCSDAEELIAESFSECVAEKKRLREISDPGRPVGEVLGHLIARSEQLAAQIGDL